jgi:hypothetical protein
MAMKPHTHYEELLPLYAAGHLQGAGRVEIENHLLTCVECQADLELWKAVSTEMVTADRDLSAPPDLANQALGQIHKRSGLVLAIHKTWQLLCTQVLLVQSDLWPASAAVMIMGVMVALLADNANIVFFVTPLMAASTLAVLYGPQHDPAMELSLSTPTSPWRILLARLSVVSAYNLLLALAATLVLLFIVPPGMLGTMILGWLGPLAFLSALALLLSVWLGTSSAITITYSLWILQYIPFKAVGLWINSPVGDSIMAAYQQFWHSPLLLLLFSMLLIGAALWSANRPVFRLTQMPG